MKWIDLEHEKELVIGKPAGKGSWQIFEDAEQVLTISWHRNDVLDANEKQDEQERFDLERETYESLK